MNFTGGCGFQVWIHLFYYRTFHQLCCTFVVGLRFHGVLCRSTILSTPNWPYILKKDYLCVFQKGITILLPEESQQAICVFTYLFNICSLCEDAASESVYIAPNESMAIKTKLQRCGNKRVWFNLRNYSSTCLEALKETITNFCKGTSCPSRDSNRTESYPSFQCSRSL